MKKSIIKYCFFFLIFLLSTVEIVAQAYKIPMSNNRNGKLILNDVYSRAPIEGYAGDEIIITLENKNSGLPVEGQKNKPALTPETTDNTGIGLHVAKKEKLVTITGLNNIGQPDLYRIKVPYNIMLEVNWKIGFQEELYVRNIKNDVNIIAVYSVRLHDVEGAIFVETKSGIVDVAVKNPKKNYPVSIIGYETQIYIRVPGNAGMNAEVNCVGGGALYTDFGFSSSTPDNRKNGKPRKTTWEMNGGGAIFKITNYTGDVYFKKLK